MSQRGVSLIIVIFAMMLLGMLGWTLAALIATDFDANLRSLEAEQAFYAAEAGSQWALGQLYSAFNCSAIDAASFPHTFANGQYSCTCAALPQGGIEVVSSGYVPSESSYRAKRQIKLTVLSLGTLNNVISGSQLFDWSGALSGQVVINGDIRALNFNRDNDAVYNEVGIDVGNFPNRLPPGNKGVRTYGEAFTLPAIDEAELLDFAQNTRGRVYYSSQTFTGTLNNRGVYFVYGNAAVEGAHLNKTSIYATGDISITGSVSMKASNTRSVHETFPNLATKNGNIYTTDLPGSIIRDFDGLIYSQNGSIDIGDIQGVAVIAPVVRLRGHISLTYDGKYVDGDAFIQGASEQSVVWQEQ